MNKEDPIILHSTNRSCVSSGFHCSVFVVQCSLFSPSTFRPFCRQRNWWRPVACGIPATFGQFLKIVKTGSRKNVWRNGGEASLREGGSSQGSPTRVF